MTLWQTLLKGSHIRWPQLLLGSSLKVQSVSQKSRKSEHATYSAPVNAIFRRLSAPEGFLRSYLAEATLKLLALACLEANAMLSRAELMLLHVY